METAKHFVRYALPAKLSRCNDNASPSLSPSGLRHRLRNRVRLCQILPLLCLSFYFRVPGYPTVTGIGYPVPKISVNARAYSTPTTLTMETYQPSIHGHFDNQLGDQRGTHWFKVLGLHIMRLCAYIPFTNATIKQQLFCAHTHTHARASIDAAHPQAPIQETTHACTRLPHLTHNIFEIHNCSHYMEDQLQRWLERVLSRCFR